MRLLTIVGARPQFIKAAVVSLAIQKYNAAAGSRPISETLLHTGQHFDFNMSEVFFQELGLPSPAHHLGIGGLGHGAMTGRMLERIDQILEQERPDAVLVYGDTNSTLAGALAAAKRHIPVGHVEAGLRSFNRRMPEEINRVLTDQLSRWLFCPTSTAIDNLRREGIEDSASVSVSLVGDVMYDASLVYRGHAQPTAPISELISEMAQGFYLATVHREENTGGDAGSDRFGAIISTLDDIGRQIPIVMPAHPRIRAAMARLAPKHIRVLDPVGYFDMMVLTANCKAVITDSGGLQKEAYFFRKPCIILRDETEWIELLARRCAVLVGADPARILQGELQVRTGGLSVAAENLYGHGDASRRIVETLGAVA